MQIFVRKWGDSMGIRIPADYCHQLNLQAGAKLEMSLRGNKITIVPKKSKLDEMVEKMTPKTHHSLLMDWKPVGNEEW